MGLGDQATFCRDLGPLPPCDAPAEGAVGGFLFPPGAPGSYPVRAALLHEIDCDTAIAGFGSAKTAGVLRVGGDCTPASCADMGLECGGWGDGCGHPLDCGSCPNGQTCMPDGGCETTCAAGIMEVGVVEINQSGPAGSAAPGQQFPVSLHWTLGNPDDCDGCNRQLVIGIDDVPGACTELDAPATCPDTTDDLLSVYLTAPAASGDHTVYFYAPLDDVGCAQAELTYPSSLGKVPIGTLHVTDGCAPKTCFTLGAVCGPENDSCGFELDCGECPPGDLCFDGTCACFAHDNYEPNDAPVQAFDLGTFPDSDPESTVEIVAMIEAEIDWYRMGAMDEMWAYINPVAHVEMGSEQPYTVEAVYICSDGSVWESVLTANAACTWTVLDFNGVPGLTGPVSGWRCESNGADLDLELGPNCPAIDDSGQFFISVGNNAGCSSYDLLLHL